ncbi:MAG: arginine repressor [Ruminococcus sp.]|nr:arginine repressor [Ruminococcus sp.]
MKNKRLDTILRLIAEHDIGTQEELCALLAGEGFSVTQATVSRDIKELALIKVQSGGRMKYSVPALKQVTMSESGSLIFSMIFDSVRSVDFAMNTVVIKCKSGMAQAICAKLDSTDLLGAVGTLAGDDTIFILMRTERDAERLVKELNTILNTKN